MTEAMPPTAVKNDLIMDVGMNRGEDTRFYLAKGFRVVAYKANRELCDEAARDLRSYIESGQLVIRPVAIHAENKPVTFFYNDSVDAWGTTDVSWVKRNEATGGKHREGLVAGVRFEDELERYGVPYYMKVDIEGADMLCVRALEHGPARPTYVSIESSKTSFEALFDELATLWHLGYRRFKAVHQATVGRIRLPDPAREGRHVAHTFVHGSSGPFGEETPGEWLTIEAVLEKYRGIYAQYRLFGDFGWFTTGPLRRVQKKAASVLGLLPGWYDTHAKHGSACNAEPSHGAG